MIEARRVYFVDNGTIHKREFINLLDDCAVCEVGPERLNDLCPFPGDVVILSGGNHTVVGQANIERSKEIARFITDAHCPIIGVCQGAQQIGFAFHSLLQRKENRVQKFKQVKALDHHPIFDGVGDEFLAYFGHRWFFHQNNLKPPLIPLAVDSSGVVAVFAHDSKPIVGMQFHQEVRSNTLTRMFWQNTLRYVTTAFSR